MSRTIPGLLFLFLKKGGSRIVPDLYFLFKLLQLLKFSFLPSGTVPDPPFLLCFLTSLIFLFLYSGTVLDLFFCLFPLSALFLNLFILPSRTVPDQFSIFYLCFNIFKHTPDYQKLQIKGIQFANISTLQYA